MRPEYTGHNGSMTHPLVEEVTKKAAIAWIAVDDGPAYALWCLSQDGALHVVVGPGEQSLPGLAQAITATVTLRGDHGGGVVSYPAAVSAVAPHSEQWDAVAAPLAGKRLNAAGTTEQVVQRWAAECTLIALTPVGDPIPLADRSHAAEPRPTSAANSTRKPFRLHRVRRR